MDPNVLTISLSRWMSLPDLDLRHWEKLVEAEQLQKSVLTEHDMCAYMRQEKLNVCKTASRVSVGTVAAYYKDYVRRKGLKQYFRWYILESVFIRATSPVIDFYADFHGNNLLQRDHSYFGKNELGFIRDQKGIQLDCRRL